MWSVMYAGSTRIRCMSRSLYWCIQALRCVGDGCKEHTSHRWYFVGTRKRSTTRQGQSRTIKDNQKIQVKNVVRKPQKCRNLKIRGGVDFSKSGFRSYTNLINLAGLAWPQIQDMDETALHNRLLATPVHRRGRPRIGSTVLERFPIVMTPVGFGLWLNHGWLTVCLRWNFASATLWIVDPMCH